MKTFLTTLLFIQLTHFGMAQSASDSDTSAVEYTTEIEFRNAIKIDPLRIFDFLHSTTLLSYERYMGQHWGIEAAAGFMHRPYFVGMGADDLSDNRGFMASLHFKYYLDRNDPRWGSWYVGGKARYFKFGVSRRLQFSSDSLVAASTADPVNGPLSYVVGQHKWQAAVQATVGYHKGFERRMEFDAYAALGLGYRSLYYTFPTGVPTDLKNPNWTSHGLRGLYYHDEGEFLALVFSLHLQIGVNWGKQSVTRPSLQQL